MIDLSVIIVSYNVEHFLHLCLESVYVATKNINAEVIVIDNASVDKSGTWCENNSINSQIANVDNLGFGKANNQAAKLAKGRYLCVLNPDVASENDLSCLLLSMNQTPIWEFLDRNSDMEQGSFYENQSGAFPRFMRLYKSLGLFKLSPHLLGSTTTNALQNKSGKTDVLVGAFVSAKTTL